MNVKEDVHMAKKKLELATSSIKREIITWRRSAVKELKSMHLTWNEIRT